MNADGSNLHALGDLEGSDPSWSPDGTRLAFEAYQSGRSSIAIASADGTQPVLLTTPADLVGSVTNDWRPAWSPDGTRIAFTRGWRYADGHGGCQVFVMNADGSNPMQLTNDPFCSSSPAWSPDGATIAFTGAPDGFHGGIMLMNADGSNQRLIRPLDSSISRVAWAPRR
jgi:Tol biopolymer transport system component